MPRVTDTPEARAFWDAVDASAREVESWPAWRRRAAMIAIDPEYGRAQYPCTPVAQCACEDG